MKWLINTAVSVCRGPVAVALVAAPTLAAAYFGLHTRQPAATEVQAASLSKLANEVALEVRRMEKQSSDIPPVLNAVELLKPLPMPTAPAPKKMLAQKTPATPAQANKLAATPLRVHALGRDRRVQVALVNGALVRVGESVAEGVRLEAIGKETAIFTGPNGNTREVPIHRNIENGITQ